MRRTALLVLPGLLVACAVETKPSATLTCKVGEPPSLQVNFGIGSGGKSGFTRLVDYGDGQTSDAKSELEVASHTYERPGRYTVRLTVTADNGTARDECVVTVPQR